MTTSRSPMGVRAVTDAEAIPIDERRFLFLVQHTPLFAIRVMRVLSSRLRSRARRCACQIRAAAQTAIFYWHGTATTMLPAVRSDGRKLLAKRTPDGLEWGKSRPAQRLAGFWPRAGGRVPRQLWKSRERPIRAAASVAVAIESAELTGPRRLLLVEADKACAQVRILHRDHQSAGRRALGPALDDAGARN